MDGTECRPRSGAGSGYKRGTDYHPGCQGGSTFVDERFQSTIKQNTEIPSKKDVNTVPFIMIKLL